MNGRVNLNIGLARRIEEGVGHGAVFDRIAPASDGVQGFAEAHARFLNAALFAGDRECVCFEGRVFF